MDPREQLRRYLLQRRELGETELMLDSMTVDEALRIVGAGQRAEAVAEVEPDEGIADWRRMMGGPPAGPTATGPTPAEGASRGAAAAGKPVELHTTQVVREAASAPTGNPSRPAVDPLSLAEMAPGIVIGSADGSIADRASPWNSLEEVAAAVAACRLCSLHATARNPVPGVGDPNADLVCVGEAPGANEDEQGEPFVGQAGQLLTKILAAIDLPREKVFICNVLKHRPPGNRNPLPEEVKACAPYLVRQVELIRPKVILALGTFAAQTLLQTKEAIGRLRGRIHRYHGVPLIATYHPAALLRNPSWKRPTWEDVQLARRLIDNSRSP
ncbi:MAG: uracil-DNA glycosylase [Gemmatimonadota bacterium]